MVFILSTILGMSAICMFCAILGQSSVEQMKLFVYEELPVCLLIQASTHQLQVHVLHNVQHTCTMRVSLLIQITYRPVH